MRPSHLPSKRCRMGAQHRSQVRGNGAGYKDGCFCGLLLIVEEADEIPSCGSDFVCAVVHYDVQGVTDFCWVGFLVLLVLFGVDFKGCWGCNGVVPDARVSCGHFFPLFRSSL